MSHAEAQKRYDDKHRAEIKVRRQKYNKTLRGRLWQMNNQDKIRDAYYKRTYGITLQQYEELLARQHNACAICKTDQSDLRTRLAVDHDHTTQEVRGLLCWSCNHRLIGRHRMDHSGLFREAARYLEQGTGWYAPIKARRKRRKTTNRRRRNVSKH